VRRVFDLSSAARWSGEPGGIVRCQRQLAVWALGHAPDVVFAVFDPAAACYRRVSPAYLDAFIAGEASLNSWGLPDPNRPSRLRLPPAARVAGRPRQALLTAAETLRLGRPATGLAAWADRLQRRLMTEADRRVMVAPNGARRPFPSLNTALAEPVELGEGDVLICAGWWAFAGIEAILRAKADRGFRLAVLCYDLIPLVLPQFFSADGVDAMANWWRQALAGADLIVVNAEATARDLTRFSDDWGVRAPRIAVSPLGADPSDMRPGQGGPLPAGLEDGKYALFVSMLSPHKGHALLYHAWRELLARGVPQAAGFKLVFVGRAGWQKGGIDELLAADQGLEGSIVRLSAVADETLDALYRRAAFCLFPSLYEGYGLPVVEALARGKAVLSSDAGSLPEVVNGFSPVLPAGDLDAWREALGAWIADPSLRAPFETAIRERFTHPTWAQAAERFFELVAADPRDPPRTPQPRAEALS
jgi:glycosyltransferase involved in cell wall biosynthesis